MQSAFLTTVLFSLIAFGVGWVLKSLASPKSSEKTPMLQGLRIGAYGLLLGSLTSGPKVISQPGGYTLISMFITLAAAWLLFFGGGYVYGLIQSRRSPDVWGSKKEKVSVLDDGSLDEHFYEQAAMELAQGQMRKGLWAQAYAQEDGDAARTRARYLRLRVAAYKQELSKPPSTAASPPVVSPKVAIENNQPNSSPLPAEASSYFIFLQVVWAVIAIRYGILIFVDKTYELPFINRLGFEAFMICLLLYWIGYSVINFAQQSLTYPGGWKAYDADRDSKEAAAQAAEKSRIEAKRHAKAAKKHSKLR